MRKTLVAAAAATILSAGAFLTSGANAMTLTAPAGVRLATEGVNVAEPVRHRCFRSRYGRLVCHGHRRMVYGGGYGYGGYPDYGYGGYPYYGTAITATGRPLELGSATDGGRRLWMGRSSYGR